MSACVQVFSDACMDAKGHPRARASCSGGGVQSSRLARLRGRCRVDGLISDPLIGEA